MVNAGVVYVPDVPLRPLGYEKHVVLWVDDQVKVVVALYATDVCDAEMETVGALALPGGGVLAPGPLLLPEKLTGGLHAERANPKTSAVNRSL